MVSIFLSNDRGGALGCVNSQRKTVLIVELISFECSQVFSLLNCVSVNYTLLKIELLSSASVLTLTRSASFYLLSCISVLMFHVAADDGRGG